MRNNKTQLKVDIALVDIAKLQVRVDDISVDVKDIKQNHLKEIYGELRNLNKRIAYWSGGLAMVIIILQYLFRK